MYACPVCDRAFKSFAALKLHFGRAHSLSADGSSSSLMFSNFELPTIR